MKCYAGEFTQATEYQMKKSFCISTGKDADDYPEEYKECVTELVKSLRTCAKSADPVDECEFSDCGMHKDRDSMCLKHLLNKAADMIEKLSRKDKE